MTYIWLKAGKTDHLRNTKGTAEGFEAAEFRPIPDEHQANRRQSGLIAEACEGSNQIGLTLLFGQPPHGNNHQRLFLKFELAPQLFSDTGRNGRKWTNWHRLDADSV